MQTTSKRGSRECVMLRTVRLTFNFLKKRGDAVVPETAEYVIFGVFLVMGQSWALLVL